MKPCPHCQAQNADEAMFCTACGKNMTENSGYQPQTKEKKKLSPGLVAVITLAVALAVVAALAIRSAKTTPAEPETPAIEAPAEEQTPVEEEPAYEDVGTTDMRPAHHANAFGFNSHSIRYAAAEDGTMVYDYQDETGAMVSVPADEVEALMDQEVASAADHALTNRQLAFYYDEVYYGFYSQYGSYLSFLMDTSRPMDEQLGFDGVNTWQQSFVEGAVSQFHQISAMLAEAEKNGFEMPEDDINSINDTLSELNDMALQNGYAGADEYLQSYYGPGTDINHYAQYLADSIHANSYRLSLMDQMTVADADIDAYYESNAEMLQSSYGLEHVDKPVVNVRHILITPETSAETGEISEEAWVAAEAEAQRVYDEWMAGEATEQSFNELAQANTDDPGSVTTGGLYNDVYPGQMVTEFNDWCFADGRQTGDSGIVKTSYGYHIMYYVGAGDTIYWREVVRELILGEALSNTIAEITAQYPLTVDYGKAVMLTPETPSDPSTVEETPAE